mmetsp:Transcript_47100/g.98640  ORF Transcript_47100/g.98640 Transcript_47100/m.98640 type:complete len:325 (+) Transcript_47100:647-1621(+)
MYWLRYTTAEKPKQNTMTKQVTGDSAAYARRMMNMSITSESKAGWSRGPGLDSGLRPIHGAARSLAVRFGPRRRRSAASRHGTGRSSSRPSPTKYCTSMSCMKKDACAGSLLPRISIMVGPGFSASCCSKSRMEPDTAETKKICTTLKKASLLKSDACTAVSATCPSMRAKTVRMMGRMTMRTMSATGATCASTWSKIGLALEASWRKGNVFLSDSTCEKLATMATGMVQNTHSAIVRAPARTDEACEVAWGRPTLDQHTSLGSGASATHRPKGAACCTVCRAVVAERSERKDTNAPSRTSALPPLSAGGSAVAPAARAASCRA